MKVTDIHTELLNHLLLKEVHFKPRKINRGKRLENGYWFLGTENYINIGFWGGKDWFRKINNIGFTIELNKGKEVFLCLTARQNPTNAKHLEKIAKLVGAKKDKNQVDLWKKNYKTNVTEISQYLDCLDEFLLKDRDIIHRYILENNAPFNIITTKEFNKSLLNLSKYKNSGIPKNLVTKVIKAKKTIKRKGTKKLNIEKQLRKIYEKEIEVQSQHKELQLRLKELNSKNHLIDIVFEENFVDVKVIFEDEIHLYEVKTAKSATKCIKQGLGQLLYYQSQNTSEKVTKLFIAGPSKPNDSDIEFINFLKNSLQIKFSYFAIE